MRLNYNYKKSIYNITTSFALSCAALLISSCSDAVSQTTRQEKLAAFTLPEPHLYTLDNGLELLIHVDKRAPVVSHSIWYRVGAADEMAGESGLAHFFEHLMFKGTKNYPAGYFSDYVAEIGGEDNAYTTNDYTVYYQNIAKEHLETIMQMESDRMVNLDVPDEEFYRERDVILEERSVRIDNNPTALLTEQLSAMLYRNHPYGSPTIGWRHEISELTPASARAFYKKYYAPNNAVVTIVGDVNPEDVLKIAKETYGKHKPSPDIQPYMRPSEPPQNITRSAVFRDEKVRLPTIIYYAQGLSPHEGLDPIYALAAGLKALGGGDQSYLYKKLVKQDKIALSVGVYTSVETIDASSVIIQAIPADGVTVEELDKALSTALADIIAKKLDDDMIENAKNNMMTEFIRASDSRGNLARFWGTGIIRKMPMEDMRHFTRKISDLTPKDINTALETVFTPNNRVTGYLLPK